jgi:hypothetical protein
MDEKFYHVLAAIGDGKVQMLFSDLSSAELNRSFVKQYRRGQTFFAGQQLVKPSELRTVQVVETSEREATARERLNRDDLARIDALNRSSNIVFISPGIGYEPEDLVEAGADVTREYLTRGPGSSPTLFGISKSVLLWILGIVAAAVSTGLAKWLGWA